MVTPTLHEGDEILSSAEHCGIGATFDPSQYKHCPLPQGKWFRLLRLLSGEFDDIICCELVSYEIEKAPAYEPISYCWGDPTHRIGIQCDGLTLNITASLFKALRQFRHPKNKEPRLLWADGVCIDQMSVEERGSQVGMMDQVYLRGQCTLVWLGECEDIDAEQAFTLIKEFNIYMRSEFDCIRQAKYDAIDQTMGKLPAIPAGHPLLVDIQRWDELRKLLERPWFVRVWGLQEVGLSKQSIAFCGDCRIEFGELPLFAEFYHYVKKYLSGISVQYAFLFQAFNAYWAISRPADGSWINRHYILEELAAFLSEPPSDGILVLLHLCRVFKATLDADHIYALFGHPDTKTTDKKSNIIDVDYKRSIEDTHRLLSRQILFATNSLQLLCYVQHWDQDFGDVAEKKFPSWIPTFHLPSCFDSTVPHNAWDAALSKNGSEDFYAVPTGDELTVHALLLDTVTKCSDPFPKDESCLPRTISDCWEMFTQAANIDPMDDDFWVRDEVCVPLRMFVWTLVHHYDFGELLATDFIEYCRLYCSPQFYQTFANRLTSLPGASSERFAERLGMCSGKKIFITREGHFGMGLRPTREGDVLAIVFGCPMPMLLRPTEDVPPKFRLVGQAYVDNLMSGEAVMKWKDGKFQTGRQEIVLI